MTPNNGVLRPGRFTTETFALGYTARTEKVGSTMVRSLVESGTDVNRQDLKGTTALHEAASNGNLGVVTYPLSKKAGSMK